MITGEIKNWVRDYADFHIVRVQETISRLHTDLRLAIVTAESNQLRSRLSVEEGALRELKNLKFCTI